MQLRALTDGSVSGTGTVTVQTRLIGGVLITADGTNDATIVLRRVNDSGKQIFKFVAKSPQMVVAPIGTESADTVYYSISGTNAAAQLYEWVE